MSSSSCSIVSMAGLLNVLSLVLVFGVESRSHVRSRDIAGWKLGLASLRRSLEDTVPFRNQHLGLQHHRCILVHALTYLRGVETNALSFYQSFPSSIEPACVLRYLRPRVTFNFHHVSCHSLLPSHFFLPGNPLPSTPPTRFNPKPPQMSKRASRSKNRGSVLPAQSSTDAPQERGNGHANASATMNGVMLEHRRKHASFDSTTPSSQAASLMGNSNFSLDDEVLADEEGPSKGFFELSKKDQRNFLLLVLLYFLQGIPMGLAHGSVPFLLKNNVSYSAIGVFSLAAYPYSLKLLWSPIVDAVWSPKVGRRKSWILPIQTISGFSMIWLGKNINRMMTDAGESDSSVWTFTWWWFALVFLCATQDIAVDGEDISPIQWRIKLTRSRLGSHAPLKRKPRIRFDRTNRWPYRWPVPFVHRFPRIQLQRFCKQVVPPA